MNRAEVLNSPHLLKRFCKDTGTPINVFQDPYFSERLETLDCIFGCKEKFELFLSELEAFENAQEYMDYYNDIKESVISYIKNNGKFVSFNMDPLPCLNKDYPYPSKDCYKSMYDGKSVISIDMKKANFSALSVFDKDIFIGSDSWEEFLSNFTGSQYIIQSKYIRQVIMGTCNPKRQVSYEKYLMGQLLDHIQDLLDVNVVSFSNDEIILLPKETEVKVSYQKVKETVSSWEHADIIRVSLFTLEKLPVTDGWRRKIYDGKETKIDFKKMPADYYHLAVKKEYGLPVTENDLVFYHDGRLAQFLEPIF